MKLTDLIKKHKKKATAAGVIGGLVLGEGTTGFVSKVTGAALSASSSLVHTEKRGQFWEAANDYSRIRSRLSGNEPREPKDGLFSLFPDPTVIERWPITKNNEISIRSADGRSLVTRHATREYIKYDEIPRHVVDAFVWREDRNFWDHDGVNWRGKLRIPYDIIRRGRLVWNSGITEQVAKWMFTPRGRAKPPRSGLTGLAHKLFLEVPYAMELDHRFSKEKILEFYINNAYFGDRNFGIVTAAQSYFEKEIKDLTLPESLFLAVLLNNPGRNPKINGGLELQTREYIAFVESLHRDDLITDQQYESCMARNAIRINKKTKEARSEPSFHSAIRTVSEELERYDIDLFDYLVHQENPGFGFVVNTSLDRDLTNKLYKSFRDRLRIGRDRAEGAGVVLDKNGRVVAIIGRRNYDNWGNRNLAVEVRIPKASTVKPFWYAICYDLGLCNSREILVDDPNGLRDPPANWDHRYGRRSTLEQALADSSNVITRKVYDRIPFYQALAYLERLGFDVEEYRRVGALDANNNALGSRHATPLEIAAAYNVFISGEFIAPTIIDSIGFGNGDIVRHTRQSVRVFRPETVDAVRSSLRRAANRIVGRDYEARIYLKTGTSDETVYAWVAGGLSLDEQFYSLAFVALNEEGRSMGDDLYASQIVGPVVRSFVGRVSPVFRVAEPIATPEPTFLQNLLGEPTLDQVCTTYTPAVVNERLRNENALGLGRLLDDMRSCANLYDTGSRDWIFFKFYEASASERLYKIYSESYSPETELSVSHLRNAVMAYESINRNTSEDNPYYIDARDRFEGLSRELERVQH